MLEAKLRVSAPRRSQLIGSTSCCAHAMRDLPLPKMGEGAIIGPTTTPIQGNVGCTPSLIDAGSCPDDCSGFHRMPARATRSLTASKIGIAYGCRPGSARQTSPTNRAMPGWGRRPWKRASSAR